MTKTVVFDLDNTLIEWKKEYIFALENVIRNLKLDYSTKTIRELDKALGEYEKYFSVYSKENMLNFLNEKANTNLPEQFIDMIIEEQSKCYEVFDGTKLDTIKYLSSKYKLICISNWFTETQTKRLIGAGIYKYFDVVKGWDGSELKPSVKAFSIITNPSECVMVGDNMNTDILPALKLGMKAILITKKKVKNDPRYKVIKNLEELKEML